jgi:hypothetical protein
MGCTELLMQMLLNLLTEMHHIWKALYIKGVGFGSFREVFYTGTQGAPFCQRQEFRVHFVSFFMKQLVDNVDYAYAGDTKDTSF